MVNAKARLQDLFVPLRTRGPHSRLGISPNELDLLSIAIIICLFIVRTIEYSVGLGLQFSPLKAPDQASNQNESPQEELFALPDLSLYMPLRLGAVDANGFARAIGLGETSKEDVSVKKAQLCLYLAALSEPAMLLMLAKHGCPIRPLGAVNVRNRFEIIRLDLCRALHEDPSSFTASLQPSVLAKFPRPARRVRRGIEIDIEVSIIAGSNADNNNNNNNENARPRTDTLFRQEFTMLQFMKFKDKRTLATEMHEKPHQSKLNNISETTGISIVEVTMGQDAPRLWARLCKDYNPIHFSSVLARLLGQPGQLAHGNHAIGVCLQAMSRHVNGALVSGSGSHVNDQELDTFKELVSKCIENSTDSSERWWMEVQFRRPIVLPAQLHTRLSSDGNGFYLVDSRSGKTTVDVVMGSF